MKLSIVTINYNNADGLKRTLESVAEQGIHPRPFLQKEGSGACELEHIIVDGGSTDGSVDIIKEYVCRIEERGLRNAENGLKCEVKWVSEKDKGIYDAMNKGIKMAIERKADYIQILNSGDMLANDHVLEDCKLRMAELGYPEMMYGNMIKRTPEGKIIGKSGEVSYSLLQYFVSTMNHDCCWIKRALFDSYGLYDENLKIVSDWKWFLQAIGLGKVKPVYADIDMTIFDTEGISEKNLQLRYAERRKVLEEVMPPAALADYDKHAFEMHQMDRLRKHHLYGVVYLIERVLFKLEKWHILK